MPGRRQRGRWGRGRRRAWFLEPALLLLLHQQPAHGYTLVDRLAAYGLDAMNPRVVYRALSEMEEDGWVTSTWDEERSQGPPRRVYRLTAQGDQALQNYAQTLQQTRAQIDHLIDTYNQHMQDGQGDHHRDPAPGRNGQI